MGYARILASGLAVAALGFGASPATAQEGAIAAEQVRRLDIMLMVTALRCRFGPDDFRADYQAFSARHLDTLNAAARELTENLSAQYGTQGARRALDRLSTSMANSYGNGHPTLGCSELKQAAQDLAYNTESTNLAAAADELLAGQSQDSVLLIARY